MLSSFWDIETRRAIRPQQGISFPRVSDIYTSQWLRLNTALLHDVYIF